MSKIGQAKESLVQRILKGNGKASPSDRLAAFNNSGVAGSQAALVDKVARDAYRITDEDMAAAKLSGLSEDQLFEITVCAAVGQATRQYDAAFAALEAAAGKD